MITEKITRGTKTANISPLRPRGEDPPRLGETTRYFLSDSGYSFLWCLYFSDASHQCKLEFDVGEFFMFGSPLALVLAYRKISSTGDKNSNIPRPLVNQVYNLFHPTDPVAARLEPLISARFSLLPPVNVARYQKYPLGNGQPYHLLEAIQTNPQLFVDGLNVPTTPMAHMRRMSEISLQSTMSGVVDSIPLQAISACE